jgi:hypothetical protein
MANAPRWAYLVVASRWRIAQTRRSAAAGVCVGRRCGARERVCAHVGSSALYGEASSRTTGASDPKPDRSH